MYDMAQLRHPATDNIDFEMAVGSYTPHWKQQIEVITYPSTMKYP
jgi:hypothetical protein